MDQLIGITAMTQTSEPEKRPLDSKNIFGGPTKRFFVSMLPRDIKLEDAILDLIDNCVDGAMRQQKHKRNRQNPFKGYFARLTLSSNSFEITDNCGGIPEGYVEGAFTLGRPKIDQDSELPTIGMYGIGMKRAVFKIGNEALVQSNSKDGFFEVVYSRDWLNPDNDEWYLPIEHSPTKKADKGVTITVTDLKKEIGKSFNNDAFLNRLKAEISEHYGYLIQKGFSVAINGEELIPKTLKLKFQKHSTVEAIRPFDYVATFDGVDIKVTVGFFRPLAKEDEIDAELEGPKEKDVAGVSVVCNDRVILLADRSMKTGWGDGGVPKFHPQFRSIAGLIVFSSSHAEKLPINTTKRDLDVGSDVYLKARKALMEGLKTFTNFTNKWKGMEDDTDEFFLVSRSDAKTQVTLAADHGKGVRGEPKAKKYIPNLPLPVNRDPNKRISFVRRESKIEAVSKFLFDDSGQTPATVGEECFDRTLKEAKKK